MSEKKQLIQELADKVKAYLKFNEAPVELAEATLKDGTKISYEGELAPGVAINVTGEEGSMSAPDGEHELESGEILVVAEGKLVEVKQPEAPQEEGMGDERIQALENRLASLESLLTTSTEAHRKELATAQDELKASREAFAALHVVVEKLAAEPSAAPTEPVKNVFSSTKKADKAEQVEKLAATLKQLKKEIN